ncbi:hypothetical protein [Streptomyces chryseus]|uniref:hypothetical protein n=1 Tax=Streptomyces chryseus TaxID=68186 RepID=UPI00110F6B10|nr:hypothetical protein [Streptomyces chryseus]
MNVANLDGSIVVVAGGDVGPVSMHSRQPLPVTAIPELELKAVDLAWVGRGPHDEHLSAVAEAERLLRTAGPALTVIAGAPGLGKRSIGLRTGWLVAHDPQTADGETLQMKEIRPDWEKPEAPDVSLLPQKSGIVYLLDVASEIDGWTDSVSTATALIRHAENLRRVNSYLVVIADERGWPEEQSGALGGVLVRAKTRPSPHHVAAEHLKHVYGVPDRAVWVESFPQGPLAHLLTKGTSPADAVRLAAVAAVVEDSDTGRETATNSFQQWSKRVEQVFTTTQELPEDRALLISSLLLGGEEAVTVQNHARQLLGEDPESSVRKILTGPDLTTRLEAVGATVAGRVVSFDEKPGYARAVLIHLWHQRPDIHEPLLTWLDGLVTTNASDVRLASITGLLVDLAIAENDVSVVNTVKGWVSDTSSERHLNLIASVLDKAAEADALGPLVRKRLIDWASSDQASEAVARVIALVCRGSLAEHYPLQALARLRHILRRPERDAAVREAEASLRHMATVLGQLPRVWETVRKWAKDSRSLAGARAFLSILDPEQQPQALQVLLASAQQDQEVADALVEGWTAALEEPGVHEQCRQVLHGWARARAAGDIDAKAVKEILDRIVEGQLYTLPISDLIYGVAGVAYDEAIIDLRAQGWWFPGCVPERFPAMPPPRTGTGITSGSVGSGFGRGRQHGPEPAVAVGLDAFQPLEEFLEHVIYLRLNSWCRLWSGVDGQPGLGEAAVYEVAVVLDVP